MVIPGTEVNKAAAVMIRPTQLPTIVNAVALGPAL